MCIAIGKLKGYDVPTESTLRTCFENNPDGAGFAFAYNGTVHIKKGFMTFESFMNAFNSYNERYNFHDLGLLIHFRIATHGNRDGTMTHPFPLSCDEGALKKEQYSSDYAVVHNGIISLTSATASRQTGLSDTAVFIRDYLTDIAKNDNWFYKKSNFELIHRLIDSKMAVLNSNGDIMFTDGFTEENGIFYSNSSYKENRFKVSTVTYSSSLGQYNMSDYDNGYNSYIYGASCDGYDDEYVPYQSKIPSDSAYITFSELDNDTQVVMDDDKRYEVVGDESSKYVIDIHHNLYLGCIDTSLEYDDADMPYYWWYYEKIGHVKEFLENGKPIKVNFIGNIFAYPEQILTAPANKRCV